MDTAIEKDTRLFRFGAVVPEEHQALALRLAELEDRLNGAFAVEGEPTRTIYFIPTIVEALTGVPAAIEQAEDHLFIRLEALPDYAVLVQRFLVALADSGAFEEGWLAELEACLQNDNL